MPARSPYRLDFELGLLYYTVDEAWSPLSARVPRPEGFIVIEEVDGRPCTEFRGGEEGDRAVYLMVKRGVDHLTASLEASRALGRRLHFLGVKDANAITYQLAYVMGPPPRAEVRGRGFELRLLGMHRGRLRHTGNRFEVLLEGADEGELRRRASRLSSLGRVLNYFGYQRFGVRRPNNHLVGKAIAKGDLRGAVDLLIGRPYPGEPEVARAFRSLYDSGDLEGALRAMPRRGYELERRVLSEYLRTGDPARALRASPLPPSFFVEAYQSYLFNLCLSRALEGGEVLPRLRVPARASEAEGVCKEVMREEGVEALSGPLAKAGPMVRASWAELRGPEVRGGGWVTFSLPRGSYATVVLRELLRQDPFVLTLSSQSSVHHDRA